jgi:nucleoside 2-deoxyribosyltransferase
MGAVVFAFLDLLSCARRARNTHRLVNRPLCYIASPLGFTDAGRYYYERVYLPALAQVVEPVDPWALTTPAEVADARAAGRERELALEIGRRNAEAIRRSSLLAAFLDGQEPDSGTVAEVGFAAGLGRRCFGLRSDFRQSGETGVSINLQVESFIVQSGGFVVSTLAELVDALSGVHDGTQHASMLAPARSS